MAYLTADTAQLLMDNAKRACGQSYSPYSRFPVGAAALTVSGKIFAGTNVENASFGLTICAERVAVASAIAEKEEIIAIAVYAPQQSITPCGACRQFIIEFGEHIPIVFMYQGKIVQKTAEELLPYNFSLSYTG